MAVREYQKGKFRAYKQINGAVSQFYTSDEQQAKNEQLKLDKKSDLFNALKPVQLFSGCGRLVYLRIRKYKKTSKPTFLLQFPEDGKQKKIQHKVTENFEVTWKVFFKLWREALGLSILDVLDYKKDITQAKRLYMQDVYKIKNEKTANK